MTHTPGPWTTQDYYAEKSDWFDICAEHAENGIIGSTYCQSYEQNRANAYLIAAAPDLLDALRSAQQQLEQYEQERTGETFNDPFINAAIAKAEGRS